MLEIPEALALDMLVATGFDYLNVLSPHIVCDKDFVGLTFPPPHPPPPLPPPPPPTHTRTVHSHFGKTLRHLVQNIYTRLWFYLHVFYIYCTIQNKEKLYLMVLILEILLQNER